MALYRPSVPYWTLSMSHTSTTNSGTADATYYFAVPTSGTAVTTTTSRAFIFPVAGTIIGATSVLSCTAGNGTKTATTAALGLYNKTTSSLTGDLGLTHNYANSIDVQRNTALNISMNASDVYVIRAIVPGYTTSNATALIHHVTLFIR